MTVKTHAALGELTTDMHTRIERLQILIAERPDDWQTVLGEIVGDLTKMRGWLDFLRERLKRLSEGKHCGYEEAKAALQSRGRDADQVMRELGFGANKQ
jgi:hypothetical protein